MQTPTGRAGVLQDSSQASGTLEVRVLEATDLLEKRKERKSGGLAALLSDVSNMEAGGGYIWPFVTLRAGQGPSRRSSAACLSTTGKDSSCAWYEDFIFEAVSASQYITVTAYLNRDMWAIEDPSAVIGEVRIPIIRLPESHMVEQWYQLTPRSGSKRTKAAIRLGFHFRAQDEDLSITPRGDQLGAEENSGTTRGSLNSPGEGVSMLNLRASLEAGNPLRLSEGQDSEPSENPESPQHLPTPSNMEELAEEELPTGLVDYLCILGPRMDDSTGLPNLNKGSLLLRYPLEDKPEQPLPESPQFFCFPAGMQLSYGPSSPSSEPTAATFVIKHSGMSSFGVCLHFHRRWTRLSQEVPSALPNPLNSSPFTSPDPSRTPPTASGRQRSSPPSAALSDKASLEPPNASRISAWAPVCICLLTRVPVVQPLLQWLVEIYDHIDRLLPRDYDALLSSPDGAKLSGLLRSHIVQLTLEIPLPIPGALGVTFSVLSRAITCRLPSPSFLPALNYPLGIFLTTFCPRSIINLVSAALTECKILLHSTDLAILPVVSESLLSFLYPLQWQNPYLVPLPRELMIIIETPTNYILGIHTDWLPDISRDSLRDVVLVDCDSGAVRLPARPYTPPVLPPSVFEPLMRRLRTAVYPAMDRLDSAQITLDDSCFTKKTISLSAELELRLLFVRCMAYLLAGYHDCIFYIEPTSPIFNRSRFMAEYAPPDEQPFLTRLLDTQSFQAFLESQEGPQIKLFRKQMHRALTRVTSRATSPVQGRSQAMQVVEPQFKKVADYGISEEADSWWDDGMADAFSEGEVTSASRSAVGTGLSEVKLVLAMPQIPEEERLGAAADTTYTFRSFEASHQAEEDPSQKTTSMYSKLFRMDSEPRRASAPTHSGSTDEGNGGYTRSPESAPAGPSVRFAPMRGESTESTDDAAESTSSPRKAKISARRSAMPNRRTTLSVLASPSKPPRTQSLGGSFELDTWMQQTMRLAGETSSTTEANETVSGGYGAGLRTAEEVAAAAEHWRAPRSYTVREAAEMMEVTVRDVAKALGLNFDLQRVITRGHTLFGFADAASVVEPDSASSPLLLTEKDGARSKDTARLHRCLMEAFSTGKPSTDLLEEVEGTFKLKEVRQRFLTILSQPRSKKAQQYWAKGQGPAGQFRVHSTGFEALMQLASAMCNACAIDRDYKCAHDLLLLMGKYYRVRELKDDRQPYENAARQEAQHKEFLSSRLRHHQIFQSVQLWLVVLRDQIEENEATKGFKLAKAVPSKAARFMSLYKATPEPATGSGTETVREGSDTERGERTEAETRRLILRVKSLLIEMHSVGMPDQKALDFVGQSVQLYKVETQIRQLLLKVAHDLWKIAAQQKDQTASLMALTQTGRGSDTAQSIRQFQNRMRHLQPLDERAESINLDAPDDVGTTGRSEGDDDAHRVNAQRRGQRSSLRLSADERRTSSLFPFPPDAHVQTTSPTTSMLGMSGHQQDASTHRGPVLCLDVDAEGSTGVSGGADKIVVAYGIASRSRLTSFAGHTGPVTAVCVFRDKAQEPLVASASLDTTLRLWRLHSKPHALHGGLADTSISLLSQFTSAKDVRCVLTGHSAGIVCLDKSEELQLLGTGSMDRTIKLWNVSQGRNTLSLVGHTGTISSLRLLNQTHAYRILSASHDKTMMLWDSGRGTCLRVFRSHEGWIRQVESLGKDLAVTASNDRSIRVWDLRVHNCVHKVTDHRGAVNCLQTVEEGEGASFFSASVDTTIKYWDLRAGEKCAGTYEGHSESVTCLGMQQTASGKRKLVSGSEDKRLIEWDARNGILLQSRTGHRDGLTGLCVSKKGVIITASWDHSVRLWEGSRALD